MGHNHHNTLVVGLVLILAGTIIGLNIYSFLPATSWYEFSVRLVYTFYGQLAREGIVYSSSVTEGNSVAEWSDSSKTKSILYQSFGFLVVSFILSVLILVLCVIGIVKHLKKNVRKLIFILTILIFIMNGLSAFLFFRINSAFCDDLTSGSLNVLPSEVIDKIKESSICNHFRGSSDLTLATVAWKPTIVICRIRKFIITARDSKSDLKGYCERLRSRLPIFHIIGKSYRQKGDTEFNNKSFILQSSDGKGEETFSFYDKLCCNTIETFYNINPDEYKGKIIYLESEATLEFYNNIAFQMYNRRIKEYLDQKISPHEYYEYELKFEIPCFQEKGDGLI
eukprot:gene3155-3948_t